MANTLQNQNATQQTSQSNVLDISNFCNIMVKACEASGSPILCFMNQFQLVTLYFRKTTFEKAFVVPLQFVTTPFQGVVPDLRGLHLDRDDGENGGVYGSSRATESMQFVYYSNAVTLLLETYSVINSCKPHEHTAPMSIFENGDGTLPPLSFRDYISRILRYTSLSKEVFVASLIILDRFLAASNGAVTFRDSSMHRLFFTSFVLASKLLEDDCYDMTFFAKLGGVTKKELCDLEERFLKTLNFSLGVSEGIFAWYNTIVMHLSCWIVQGHCKVRTWNNFIAELSNAAKASVSMSAAAINLGRGHTVQFSEAMAR